MDYAAKDKSEKSEKKNPRIVEKVVTGEVVAKKKSLTRKFKDLFVEADFKSVVRYIVADVLLPSARNMIVDASTKGIERMMYGESSMRRRSSVGYGSRVTYNNPINRGYRDSVGRNAPTVERGPRSSRMSRDDVVLSSREDAELVLERMNDIIETYGEATVSNLNELCGFPSSHVDEKWGWTYLGDVDVKQTRDGFLIDFTSPDPI